MPPTRFPFRLTDCGSHSKVAANELAVILNHFSDLESPKTCATCSCGKPRVCFEISGQGLARLSCGINRVGWSHVVAVAPEHAGMIYPGCPAKLPGVVAFNLAVAYGAHRGFDVPDKVVGSIAGPILTGGGTVYRSGRSAMPVYPSSLYAAKELPALMREWSSLVDRFWLTVQDRAVVAVPEPVIEDDKPEFKVAPMPKRLRFGGVA